MSTEYIIKNPVGYAFIVINSFVKVGGKALRSGWESEVILSEKLFKALGFEVIILIDITRERCLEELTKIAADGKLGNHSMFLFAIFTHGEENEALLFPNSDDYIASKIGAQPPAQADANASSMDTDQVNSDKEIVTQPPTQADANTSNMDPDQVNSDKIQELSCEKIYEIFYNNPFLKGKPKYFIINACRGGKLLLKSDAESIYIDKGDWIRLYSTIEGTKSIRALPSTCCQEKMPSLFLVALYCLYEDSMKKGFDGRDINWSDLGSHIDAKANNLIKLNHGGHDIVSNSQLNKTWNKGEIRILLQEGVVLPPLKDGIKSEVEGNQNEEKDSASGIISDCKEIALNTPANGNMGICYSEKFGLFFANREENSIYHIPTNTDKPYKVLDENSGIVGPMYVACTKINLFISHERGVSMLLLNSLHEKPQPLPFLPPSGIICPAIDTTSECVYILDRYCNKNNFNSHNFLKRQFWSYKDHQAKHLNCDLDLPINVSADMNDPFVISDIKVKFTIAFDLGRKRAYICILLRGNTNKILIYLQEENGFCYSRNFIIYGSENMDPCFFVVNDNLTTIIYTNFLTNAVKHHLLRENSTGKSKYIISPTGIAINPNDDTACILCQNNENESILLVLNNLSKLSV